MTLDLSDINLNVSAISTNLSNLSMASVNMTTSWVITNPRGLTAFLLWMSLLFVVGVTGNMLILVYYPWRQRRHLLLHGFFLKSLTVTDFITCLVIIPYSVAFELNLVPNPSVCKAAEFFRYLTVSHSLLTLLGVGVERFHSVCQPLAPLTRSRSLAIVGALAMLAVVFAAPSLVNYDVMVELSKSRKYFVMNIASCYLVKSQLSLVYGLVLLLAYLATVITMLVLYTLVYYNIVRQLKRVAPQSAAVVMEPEGTQQSTSVWTTATGRMMAPSSTLGAAEWNSWSKSSGSTNCIFKEANHCW